MENISGFGTIFQMTASITFPAGITLSKFPGDSDSIDVPSIKTTNVEMGSNGDLIVSSSANPILITLSLIADSEDDDLLAILLEASRPQRGTRPVRNIVTGVVTFVSGKIFTYTKGVITDGMPGDSMTGAGKIKTKVYAFAFEGKRQLA